MARGVNTKANGIDFRANRFAEFLKLIPQNLTAAEKAQVMANLGITAEVGSLEGAVRYDAAQTLTDAQQQQAQDNIGVAEALDGKANKDGYYSQLTAGAAENLVGGNDTSREFTEDTAGGTDDIADGVVQINKIKGNSIVWNQLFGYFATQNQGGVQITNNNDGTFTLNGTVTKDTTVYGITSPNLNKYISKNSIGMFKSKVTMGEGTTINRIRGVMTAFDHIYLNEDKTIIQRISDNNNYILIKLVVGDVYDNVTYRLQIFNLTQMFGDGNEPATVEEFEKLFPLDYYDYNEGEILSLNPTGIKTIGFNAYNPATGKAYVIGDKQYQITGAYTSISEGETTITPDSNGLFTPTNNGELTIAGGDNTTTCIHLVWSGVRNGEYEEHWEETRNIPVAKINTDGTITESADGKTRLFPDGLCSALLSNGSSIYDEITPTKAIKRIAKVDLGTLSCTLVDASIGKFYFSLPSICKNGPCALLLPEYKNHGNTYVEDMQIGKYLTDNMAIQNKARFANKTANEVKALMNGVYIYYELETPVEVTFAGPLNLTYRVSDFGTETLLPINPATPVTTTIRLDVVYGLNVVDFVRNADKNYLTIEDSTGDNGSSFNNLRSVLSSAFGIDIAPTWNDETGRYTFIITDNRKVEVPTSATASGLKGTWAEDATAVYFCTDTNVWVKIAKTNW